MYIYLALLKTDLRERKTRTKTRLKAPGFNFTPLHAPGVFSSHRLVELPNTTPLTARPVRENFPPNFPLAVSASGVVYL